MTGTARDLLTWAARQVGTMEKPMGSNQNPYATIVGHANRQPWCATFIVAGLVRNDVPLLKGVDTASAPAMHDAFRSAGRLFDAPRAGDTGYKFHPDEGRIGHVFFVERVMGDFVQTIEGNSNNDGSSEGKGVFRLQRRWRGKTLIRGFGRPPYGQAGKVPTVGLADVIDAAQRDPGGPEHAQSHPAPVRIVEAALMAEGLLPATFAKDGSFGSVTVTAYQQWQRQQGFSGKDADGIPGEQTLTELGLRHGFAVVA